MYDQWVVRWPLLRLIDALHGLAPGRVGAQSVDCLGGKRDGDVARLEESGSFLDGGGLGRLAAAFTRPPFCQGSTTRAFLV